MTEAHGLLHGGETQVWCDAGYQGVHNRDENLGCEVEWQVAMRPGKRRKLDPESSEAVAEKRKASVRAKVEHPFLKVKRLFGYAKVRYRGLAEEHESAGVAVWPRQPADGGGPTGRVTRAAVGQIRQGPPAGPVKAHNGSAGAKMRGGTFGETTPEDR